MTLYRLDERSGLLVPVEFDIPNVHAAYEAGHAEGFRVGAAQGEIAGRMALAAELEASFGLDAREDLTADAVKRIRARQVH